MGIEYESLHLSARACAVSCGARMPPRVHLLFLIAAHVTLAFNAGIKPTNLHAFVSRGSSPRSTARMGPLQDAWRRYVLLRPDMDFDSLKNSTQLRTAQDWSWDSRTPGTARTLLLSAVIVSFFAIPALLANPAVFSRLLELAALSLEGVKPALW
jgi:hypothetical protein